MLITGIGGFAGSHLAEFALNEQAEVAGTVRPHGSTGNISHLLSDLKLFECDMTDKEAVERVVSAFLPDRIYHLAAQSNVHLSWSAPLDTLMNNIAGEIHLLEAVKTICPSCRVLIAGSSEEYGAVDIEDLPVKETSPLRPMNPYAVSKVTQDVIGYQYYKSHRLHIVRTRSFHHTGPRRGKGFVTTDFCKQIVEIEQGKREPILHVGYLEAIRDFSDVRDVVRGYWMALENGDAGEAYNISTGIGYSIRGMLDILLEMTTVPVTIKVNSTLLRPVDVPAMIGDYGKLNRQTGWTPTISLKQTLADLLEEHRRLL
ncbi:MAG: GDP-mannose 4,6-dehydratase [Candidatus Pristimantibacillus sp.]